MEDVIVMKHLLAMNNDGSILSLWMLVHHLSHPPPELQQGVTEWIGMTRPLGVVKLNHFPFLAILPQANGSKIKLSFRLICRREGNGFIFIHRKSCSW